MYVCMWVAHNTHSSGSTYVRSYLLSLPVPPAVSARALAFIRNCGQDAQEELREEMGERARLRRRHRSETEHLTAEMQLMKAQLDSKSVQLARANYLHREALARLGKTIHECGTLTQQFRRELVLLRTNVARAVGIAFRRSLSATCYIFLATSRRQAH